MSNVYYPSGVYPEGRGMQDPFILQHLRMLQGVPQLIVGTPGSDAAFQFGDSVVIEYPAQRAGREHITLLFVYVIRRNQLGIYFFGDFLSSRLVDAT